MLADVLHLGQSLRRTPVSAGAAILTLSLTLGASASIFTVVDAVVLTPPPLAHPEGLVVVGEIPVDQPTATPGRVPYARSRTWRQQGEALAAIEAFDSTNVTLTGFGAAERLSVTDATPGFLPLLGVTPARGRLFGSQDLGQPVALVSYAFWQAQMAANPDVIGRRIVLGGRGHTIVGVLPERFFFPLNPSEVWRPLVVPPDATAESYPVSVVARLRGDVSSRTLSVALDSMNRDRAAPTRAIAVPINEVVAGGATKMLALLGGSAALAILIAFLNLTALLVVRAADRQRDLAIRVALGARESEIAKQLILDAETIAAIGTVGGLLLAYWMTPSVGHLVLQQFGSLATRDIGISWRAAAGVSLTAGILAALCGTLPALLIARGNVAGALRHRSAPTRRQLRVRYVLVTCEVALAFVLLASVALVGGNLVRLLDVNPGFDTSDVLTLQVSLPADGYPETVNVTSFYASLQRALEERLGAHSMAMTNEVPLAGSIARTRVAVGPESARMEAVVREAGPAYFDVMRIPVITGRPFDRRDDSSAPLRVMVSESLARRLFAYASPVGRHIWLASVGRTAEIVGSVGDVKHRALDEETAPALYLSALQSASRSNIVLIRSPLPASDVAAIARNAVFALDHDVPVYRARSMEEIVSSSPGVPARRVLAAAFMGFAVLAVALEILGLFALVAHDVSRRRAELGIRMALGAAPVRILGTALRQGMAVIGLGLTVGWLLSLWAVRALNVALAVPAGTDLVSAAVAAAVILLAAAGAMLPIALKTAWANPLVALRTE